MTDRPSSISPNLQVILHIGAHKTATSHLQSSIAAQAFALSQRGVRFIGPNALREPGQTLPEVFGFPLETDKPAPHVPPLETLARMAGDGTRLVISEENFAGRFHGVTGRVPMPLYETAGERIAKLAAAMGQDGIDVCVAIRQPATFLSSLYSQMLRGDRIAMPVSFRKQNNVDDVDWVGYIARLRAAKGVRRLIVWRYEDYAHLFPQICDVLLGDGMGALVSPIEGRSQTRLSAGAVDIILTAHKLGGAVGMAKDLDEGLPVGPDNPAFDLYDAEVHAQADVDYATQVALIAAMQDVTLLQA